MAGWNGAERRALRDQQQHCAVATCRAPVCLVCGCSLPPHPLAPHAGRARALPRV